MTEANNVLLRWARLKQEAKAAQRSEAGPAEAKAAQPGTDVANKEPFDAASLPSIDSIVADTDIAGFVQSGVPAELTRAALRRAWASDPAIRDFVGIADNQWDFNDPNGIPGFGPLGTMEGQVAFRTLVSSSLPKMSYLRAEEASSVARDSKMVQSGRSKTDAHRETGELNSTSVPSRQFADNEDAVGEHNASWSAGRAF